MQYKYPGKGAFTLTETETNKGVFTLTEAESETETDAKWIARDCVDRDRYTNRCQWVSNPF